MTLYIVVLCLTAAAVIAISVFYNFIPQKFRRALTSSLVFIFTTILVMNLLKEKLYSFGISSPTVTYLVFLGFIGSFTALCFLVTYLVKDEERQRKILFWTAVFFFALVYVQYTLDMVNGFSSKYRAVYPSHSCRQIAYGFPLVYFCSRRVREFILPFFCYAGIIGGATSLAIPDNITANGLSILEWPQLDFVALHMLLVLFPVIMFKTREVFPKWWQLVHGAVGLGVVMLFAYICNVIAYKQSGDWTNNGMFLNTPFASWLPTWALIIGGFAIAFIVGLIVGYYPRIKNYLKNKRQKKHDQQQ